MIDFLIILLMFFPVVKTFNIYQDNFIFVLFTTLFLFYGLIFFRENPHQPQVMQIFAGIFVSGGFLFTFGQFVPSWDSQYYPLMMTQNISYKNYLTSKWWLIVIATVIVCYYYCCLL